MAGMLHKLDADLSGDALATAGWSPDALRPVMERAAPGGVEAEGFSTQRPLLSQFFNMSPIWFGSDGRALLARFETLNMGLALVVLLSVPMVLGAMMSGLLLGRRRRQPTRRDWALALAAAAGVVAAVLGVPAVAVWLPFDLTLNVAVLAGVCGMGVLGGGVLVVDGWRRSGRDDQLRRRAVIGTRLVIFSAAVVLVAMPAVLYWSGEVNMVVNRAAAMGFLEEHTLPGAAELRAVLSAPGGGGGGDGGRS